MISSDAIHKLGRIAIISVVTICLTVLYIVNPGIDPAIMEKILYLPAAYILIKGTGKTPL